MIQYRDLTPHCSALMTIQANSRYTGGSKMGSREQTFSLIEYVNGQIAIYRMD